MKNGRRFLYYICYAVVIIEIQANPPSWTQPTTTAILVNYAELNTVCDSITLLAANSGDLTGVVYSVQQEEVTGRYRVDYNNAFGVYVLRCNHILMTTSPDTVVLRVTNSGDGEFADLTLTITINGLPGPAGPTWNSGDQFTLSKTDDTSCDQAAVLNATSSDNSGVTYSIISQTPDEAGFSLSISDPGLLTCTLSAITVTTYTIVVSATNSGDGESTEQTITIAVKVPPTFTEPDPDDSSENHLIYMCETSQPDDEIMTLNATDEDGDSFTYNMDFSSDSVKAKFRVVGDKLRVTNDPVDFDIDNENAVTEYPIVLTVSDGLLSSNLTTKIIVEDDNDNAPIFTGSFEATVVEGSPNGSEVLQVTAVDNDRTIENNNVTLTLGGTSPFELVGDVIKVADGNSLKYNVQNLYTLTVTASDNVEGDPQTTMQQYNITLETEPVFNGLGVPQSINVAEDASEDTEIYTFNVTDADNSGNLTLSTSDPMFTIAGTVLKLGSGQSFDAETRQTFSIKINATDEKYTVTSETLTITVTDVNEIPPQFSEADKLVEIAETITIGTVIYTVTAVDGDVSNSTMTYSLSEIGDSHFEIDSGTGKISTTTAFDYQTGNRFNIQVTASDGELSSDTVVSVKICTSPTIDDPADGSSFSIAEDTAIGSNIKDIVSSDKDGDTPIFTLISQEPDTNPQIFKVSNNGSILVDGTFDVDTADAVTSYALIIGVSDQRSITENSTSTFTISIIDANDNPPVFDQNSYTESVMETGAIGSTVLTIAATDGDMSAPNNEISYSLAGTTDFRIDEITGDILINAALEYDNSATYNIKVTATDNGTPEMSNEVNVTLNILAEPEFTNLTTEASVSIDENVSTDTIVYNITATDADDTWDGQITILTQTPADMFVVDGISLKPKTTDLDAETYQSYELTFKITDGEFNVESAKLTIDINDINDNLPVITAVAPIEITENKIIGSNVVTIIATDDDVTDANNKLSFTITDGNVDGIFNIDSTSGVVTLSSAPVLPQYNLTIGVSDNGSPKNNASTVVIINIDSSAVDECSAGPCQNGGTCTSSVNTYTCSCVPGWIGDNCETNNDDCNPNQCQNGATCTDDINTFSCNCSAGWTGQTCSTACTDNTYGPDCVNTCNCNISRIISNAENQTCDISTGNCKCNAFWTGDLCERDVNECNNTAMCNEQSNLACENTIGGYYCTCEQGFVNTSGACQRGTTAAPVTPITLEIVVKLKASLATTCPDLTVPSIYLDTERKLEEQLNKDLTSAKRIVITSIYCGSLEYESTVVINKNDSVDLANEIAAIRNEIEYDGNTVSVNSIEVNLNPVNTSLDAQPSYSVCEIYTAIEPCPSRQECVYRRGRASCEYIENDQTNLMIALVLGICLPVCVMALIAMICCYYQINRRNRDKRLKNGKEKENSPWNGRLKSNGGVRINTRDYYGDASYDKSYYRGGSFYEKQQYADVPAVGYTSL